MFRYSTEYVKEWFIKKRLHDYFNDQLTDEIENYVMNYIEVDTDIHYAYELMGNVLELVDVSIEEVNIPNEIQEDAQGCFKTVWHAFHVPGLMHYVNHPAFYAFVGELEATAFHRGGYAGDHIELFYLPTCVYRHSESQVYRDFANQPATFCIESQEEAGFSLFSIVDFLIKFKRAADYMKELIGE